MDHVDSFDSKPVKFCEEVLLDTLQTVFTEDELCNANFQDLIACGLHHHYAADDDGRKKKAFAKYINEMTFNILGKDILSNHMSRDPAFRSHYLVSIGLLIGNEITLASADYIVFYRIVQENLILYEFNTLMLAIFGEANLHDNDDRALPLICTPCLLEASYPNSVEEHLDLLKRKVIQSDMSGGVDEYLLSVNNCLSISESDSGSFYRHCHLHQREASPLDFYEGYNGINTWKHIIRAFIKFFFGESDESAKQTVELIFEKYKSQNFDKSDSCGGHLIQICIPKEHAERFAHTSFAYGEPASIYEIYNAHRPQFMAQSSFEGAPPNAKRQLSFQEIMSSEHMGSVQSRIIAHPNLFLEHGAFAGVFSGSVGFDRKKLQDDICEIMDPLIMKALGQNKRLAHYEKYQNP